MIVRVLILLGFVCVTSPCFGLNTSSVPIIGDNKGVYTVTVKGDQSLRTVLTKEIRVQRKTNLRLKSFFNRRKVAHFESNLLIQRLYAEGYYDADVSFTLSAKGIEYRAVTGELYHVRRLHLQLPDEVEVPTHTLGIKSGDPLQAASVLAATNALNQYAKRALCLWEINTDYQVTADTSTHTADLTLTLKDSPSVQFDDIRIIGLTSVDETYLLDRIGLNKGDCFKRSRIDKARLKLVQTNLIASVSPHIGEPIDGSVPVTLTVVERHHRTFSLGLGFQTDQGAGISVGWEHRNFANRSQRLKVDTRIIENRQEVLTALTIPHFRRSNQTISLYNDISREDTDAFVSNSVDSGVDVSRQLRRYLRGVAGIEVSFSNVVDDEGKDDFTLISLPMSLDYDRRQDPLDPRSGWAASIGVRPYRLNNGETTRFFQSTLAASMYVSMDNLPLQPTLAFRGALGLIDGADREEIPANVRFYVGGGGSVRGYPFQTLGPLDGTTPLGGLSFNEVSFETRVRWSDKWGSVFFIDGGLAYEDTVPQVGENLLWGTGFGIRYYTSFAPIRFDIAVPMDQRDGIDDDFQLYISIGQSF